MNKSTYFFIRDDNDFSAMKRAINDGTVDLKNSTAVLWDSSFGNFFAGVGMNCILFGQYAKKIDFSFVSKEVLKLVNEFPHIKILEGKTFVELLDYDGYSLWWFLKQGFYSHCTRVIKEIYTLKLLIKEEKIRNIAVFTSDAEFIAILEQATKNSNADVKIKKKSTGSILARNFNFFKNAKKSILNYAPRLIRAFLGFARSFEKIKKSNKWNILLFTKSDVWSNVTAGIRGDTTSYTISRDMSKSKDFNVMPLDTAINLAAAWKAIREKKKPFIPYEYFIFRSFFDFKIQNAAKKQKKRFEELWTNIDEKSNIKEILVGNGIMLYPILRQKIRSYFFNNFDSLTAVVRNIEIGKKILHDYAIDAVICVDENGNSRFLVFASKMKNVPSIALQHGLITPLLTVSYFYTKKEVCLCKKNLNCQFPNKTAVFGKKSKDMLKKIGNYSDNNLAITGQPRTDILFENKTNYSRKKIDSKLGLAPNKKLVVFASQPLDELSESKITLTAVIEAVRNLEDVTLVVKLHPGDNEEYYKKIIDDLKYGAVAIKDIDLYELLYCCDLLISIQSTVILEALLMDKPVIKVNLIENYDLFGGATPQGIIEVYNEKELAKVINKALYDSSYLEKLSKKRKKVISEYFYKIDGNSTKRFINVVRGLLEGRERINK